MPLALMKAHPTILPASVYCMFSLSHSYNLGIVVGTWPCGTVVMVGELFGAESKAQVYGNVHTFLQENSAAMTQLGNYTCTSSFKYRNGIV